MFSGKWPLFAPIGGLIGLERLPKLVSKQHAYLWDHQFRQWQHIRVHFLISTAACWALTTQATRRDFCNLGTVAPQKHCA